MTWPVPRRSGSIRRRATAASVLVAVVTLTVVFGVFYFAWTNYTLSVRTEELARQVRVVSAGLGAAGVSEADGAAGLDAARLTPLSERLLRVESGLIGARLVVTDGDGRVVYSTAEEGGRTYPTQELLSAGPDGDVFYTGVRAVQSGGSALVVGARIAGTDRYLLAVQPVQEISRASAGAIWLLALAGLAAVAAALAAGSWLARRVTGPVVRLTDGARAVTAGDWGHQVPVEGDDEVAMLAGAFNEMSTRVSDAYQSQKSFVGDVSHELRTPITSIRGFAGALLDGTVADEEGRRRSLKVIHDEAGRLTELSVTLLALADLDAGAVAFVPRRIDTVALADALGDRFGPRAAAARIQLQLGPLDGTPLADTERLLQALSILVDNALAYTPGGGRVRVSSKTESATWIVSVDDSGPGVPPEDRDRVFGRFTRLDPARSTSAGGSGLGLAICKRLVELMGGVTRVEGSDLGGARFLISLPVAG